jgi:protein-S-isoprenylcysteine O-methyltransferase Ste14
MRRELAEGLRIAGNLLIALFWCDFFVVNIVAYMHAPKLSLLLLTALEGVTAVLYITRSRAQEVSSHFADWLLGVVGTLVIMLYRPTLTPEVGVGELLVVVGALCAVLSLLSLNRSFGIVPARRFVRTQGMYRLVRHPAYASYCLLCLGYAITNPSVFNMGVLMLTTVLLIVRAQREEVLLSREQSYREYKQRVRYRLIPGLY